MAKNAGVPRNFSEITLLGSGGGRGGPENGGKNGAFFGVFSGFSGFFAWKGLGLAFRQRGKMAVFQGFKGIPSKL